MENISPLPVEITFHLFNDTFKVPPFQVRSWDTAARHTSLACVCVGGGSQGVKCVCIICTLYFVYHMFDLNGFSQTLMDR